MPGEWGRPSSESVGGGGGVQSSLAALPTTLFTPWKNGSKNCIVTHPVLHPPIGHATLKTFHHSTHHTALYHPLRRDISLQSSVYHYSLTQRPLSQALKQFPSANRLPSSIHRTQLLYCYNTRCVSSFDQCTHYINHTTTTIVTSIQHVVSHHVRCQSLDTAPSTQQPGAL